MKHNVKCPDCNREFEAEFNMVKWQLNEVKRILSKTDDEIEKEWEKFHGWIGLKDEKPR